MPTIDNETARRDARRAYLKSLKRGDFITCGLSMRSVALTAGGRKLDMTPERSAAELEAERKAKADKAWRDYCWSRYA